MKNLFKLIEEFDMDFIYKLIQDEDYNKSDAVCKFIEEAQEFLEESYKADMDIDATLGEGFDVIQSVLSYWDTVGITKDEMFEGLKKHNEKLENRGWDREAIRRLEYVRNID